MCINIVNNSLLLFKMHEHYDVLLNVHYSSENYTCIFKE